MSEGNVFISKVKGLYKSLCQEEWNPIMSGLIIGMLSVFIMMWWRPWGAVGAVRDWGNWIVYGLGLWDTLGFWDSDTPKNILESSGSVIGIGFVGGAFVSAFLGNEFAFRFPPVLEWCKAIAAGILMGIGAALAGGCNVGGMLNAIGNLSASGFAMWLGLIIGVILGLKYIYWEMENISWGQGGAKTIELPAALNFILGVVFLAALIWGANAYAHSMKSDYVASLGGVLLISAGLGYTMQRGRWCMVQGFREPHMTGDCKMAKSVALTIFVIAVGAVLLKYDVPIHRVWDGWNEAWVNPETGWLHPDYYVRGTFGWAGVVGGAVFGFGAMLAGGCGTGTLWRVGEGQLKLWLVALFFGLSNAIVDGWFKAAEFEANGVFGKKVFLPDVMGYGWSLALITGAMVLWYLIVTWNEESNKLVVEM
ncbi:MAG: YeeE/YedE thiosulfate transporter family protein [Thermodesulfobacteriota bacterium]